MLDVKEAVAVAKSYVANLFSEEGLTNIGLEEVQYKDDVDEWYVVIGFSRPWDEAPRLNALAALANAESTRAKRTMKVVRINNQSHKVVAITNRAQ